MSQITKDEIEAVAHLARLHLSEEEKKIYADQLSVIFDYVDMLEEIETDTVDETCQVTGLEDVVRDDEVQSCDEEKRKQLIASFPEELSHLLKVKAVFSRDDIS